ncbi:secretory phospholipase A2 receptor-like [Sebastes umbrosus]|uniref:secretory phospholipase A2 receptor-like n=1 Tax=Sebastes umbrosus TaxID=72105 RepID=UPI00189E0FFC|nr:secretory phospholipase A2 receptor-like [Sebastes umbrosus]
MKELGSHVETHSPQVSMMMERILLGVLSLSGWIIPSICLHRQYHYVADPKTWTEAASYCRRTYTDLASIENIEEMNQLKNTVSSSGHNSEVWIGLYSAIVWKWSDGYRGTGSRYRNWRTSNTEPDLYSGGQFCVVTGGDGRWYDDFCNREHPFVCYRGTQLDPEFVVVNERMSWSSAQRYCRENFIDLATVRNDTETQEIQSLVPSRSLAWIGLFRDPNFNWSDGSNYKFSYWAAAKNPFGSLTHVCAVAALQSSGKWRAFDCERRLPFVCYSLPVNRQVVRLRMKPEDSSLDLNDPAVKADILKKLQDRLETKVAGATLKWREQPDGKVFFKEGKSSQKKERKKTEL